MTPEQLQNFSNMGSFANTSGAPGYSNAAAAAAPGTAANLNGTGAGYGSTADNLFNLAGRTTSQGNRTTGQGVNAMGSAFNELQGFNPVGGTASNIADATQYANNPAISDMVQAGMRDATRAATEQQLPGIARNAAATGNVGSSKRGLAEGVVTRGLNDQTGDLSANLRGQAYNNGLDRAENARQFNNNAVLDAIKSSGTIAGNIAGTGVSQTGAGVSAANAGTSAGGLGLGFNNTALNATKLGLDANGQSLQQQAGLFDIANSGGAGQQQGNQLSLDNTRSMIEYANANPSSNLAQYMSIIGGQNWGGQKTGTENATSTPSPLTVAAGFAGAGASLFGGNGFNMLAPMGKAMMG